MKKNNRLSHSAINTYVSCGEKYRLHYIEKIRPITKSSALLFGDAMDKAYERLLLGKDDYYAKFNERWSYNIVDESEGEVSIAENTLVRYSKADYEDRFLLEEDKMLLGLKAQELEIGTEILDNPKTFNYQNADEKHIQLFNLASWLCLRNKAKLFLDAYKRQVLPRIKKIHSIQKEIKLENQEGDTLIGFIDIDMDYEHTDGKIYRVVADNKTSSIKYQPDSTANSQQLGLYCISEGIQHALYIVTQKKIKKLTKPLTDPDCCDIIVIDLIFDEIKQDVRDDILSTVENVNLNIKEEKFEKNPKSCWEYGGCPYRDYCWKNKDLTGLKKKE